MATERVFVRGSERQLPPNAALVGVPDPNDEVWVSIILRRKTDKLPSPKARPVPREKFAELYGADLADVELLEQFAEAYDLTVGDVDLARRVMVIGGTVANMNEAFGTELRIFQSPDGFFRGRVGALTVPSHLGAVVVAVLGLDLRPQAKMRLRRPSKESLRRPPETLPMPPTRSPSSTAFPPRAPAKGRRSRLSNWEAAIGRPTSTLTSAS